MSFDDLSAMLRKIQDLRGAINLLEWDQQTHMPAQAAEARGHTLALLSELAHSYSSSAELGRLLAESASFSDEDSERGATLRKALKLHARATKVPADLVNQIKTHTSATYNKWTEAREQGDFSAIAPYLEKTIELSRRYGECFADFATAHDALIDEQDPGMTSQSVRALFAELRGELVPIVRKIAERPQPDTSFLEKPSFPIAAQLEFGDDMARAIGYDFDRGRRDLTVHPFMIRVHGNDIRITTRVNEHDFGDCLFSMIHEAGHAIYEQGIAAHLDGSILGEGVSAGVHESQSRLWENQVGRSDAFWRWAYPLAQAKFPALQGIDRSSFVAAINCVRPSLIRTEADEVTYNLHVMLRFDLEAELLNGTLKVRDLPEAWNARMHSDLGVTPPHPKQGCMQDVHWYCTTIGGTFQGYTIGNLYAAQLFETMQGEFDTDKAIESADFSPIRNWLTERVHRFGAQYEPQALVEQSTGKPLSTAPFVRYLKNKFSV